MFGSIFWLILSQTKNYVRTFPGTRDMIQHIFILNNKNHLYTENIGLKRGDENRGHGKCYFSLREHWLVDASYLIFRRPWTNLKLEFIDRQTVF